ncbi:MAG: HAMP domain-containing sensor histidine kinase [Candidatus Paceibacterota bacterium]
MVNKTEKNLDGYEFVSLAAHQMRGPVGSIKGYLSMIFDGDFGEIPPVLLEPLETIFRSTDSLSKTINDFLDTSKMEQGQMRYYLKDFDLVDLLKQTIAEVQTTVKKELKLEVHLPRNPIVVHGDKTKLKHVFMNLIDNANKYTESGFVKVTLERHGQHKVLFSVEDSGIGFSKEVLATLFQKFSRAPEANKVNSTGTGLGLYVARKMIEAHHGQIWAESEGEGKGSKFCVDLPSV